MTTNSIHKKYKFSALDKAATCATINFYTISKEKKRIELKDFNRRNKEHMALLHISQSARVLHGSDVFIDTSFWDYLYLKIKYLRRFKIKRLKSCENIKFNPTCDEFISFIENQLHTPGVFIQIYEEYYKR